VSELRYTLLADGSSDRALMPILSWIIRECAFDAAIVPQWADFRNLRMPPAGLPARILAALDLYPCDLLFVHRDAENIPYEDRKSEIEDAFGDLGIQTPSVCVVPVRMQEAWICWHELSIREAAGNPRGNVELDIPRVRDVEGIPDPKNLLCQLILDASEQTGRRRRKIRCRERMHRIAEQIGDYSPLRDASAFDALYVELENTLEQLAQD
jgi:hypothetical protein